VLSTPAGNPSQVEDVDLSDEAHDKLVRERQLEITAWLRAQQPATGDRQTRLTRTWRVALGLLARGLDTDGAASLLLQEFNPRCSPPWETREVEDTCRRAAARRGGSASTTSPTAAPQIATPEQLDFAYRTILSRTRLTTADRVALHERGFTDEEIALLGYSSWRMDLNSWYASIADISKQLGDATFTVPGIVRTAVRPEFHPRTEGPLIPVRDLDGSIVGLRVRHEWERENKKGMPILDKDGNQKREKAYLWFSGRDRKDYPDDARVNACLHVPVHDGLTTVVIRFTEGEYKADFATLRTRILTVSIPGVGSWRLALDAVTKLGVKTVLIAFDADCETNAGVARAIVELEGALRAMSVEVQIETWSAEFGKGIDDVIHAGHKGEIRVLEGGRAESWLDDLARKHRLPGRDLRTGFEMLLEQQEAAEAPAPGIGVTPGESPDSEPAAPGLKVVDLHAVRNAQPRDRHRTDLGNAERFVDQHGTDIRFCVPWKKWLCWDGTRWKIDDTQQVERWAHDTVRAIYGEAARENDPDKRKALVSHAVQSESASRIAAMTSLAEALVPVRPEEFDRDHWLFNVQNGTVDLRTGKLREHRRGDFITKLSPVEFDPGAACPLYDAFLEKCLPDQPVRDLVCRLDGYALSGVIREHVFPIHHGKGRNGKGVHTNTLLHVMGDYAKQIPTEVLMASRGEAHPTGRATLFGVRFAAAVEAEEGAALNVAFVKQATGGDRISARKMKEDFWEFDPTHKLQFSTNHRPVIRATDDGIWDRVLLIPWLVRFAPGGDRPRSRGISCG
jgi:hypothetical protein